MSTLVLIRHGQATPFEKETDRLSATGEQQSIRLGEFFRARGLKFDEVYTGSLRRHRQTAELAGLESVERPEFNEYDADGILRAHPEYAPAVDNRQLQKMFEATMPKWVEGSLESSNLETWQAFRGRVLTGFKSIVEADGPSRRVAVFTSAGPIAVIVQTVLRAPEPVTLQLNWRVRNCSLTEFLFTRDRVSLDIFNATPHLEEVTFR